MGWFRKSSKKEAPAPEKDDLWLVCSSCTAHIYKTEWENNLKVCPKCNFHERISSEDRVEMIIDPDTFEELFAKVTTQDKLSFTDGKTAYAEKAQQAKDKTGMNESILTGRGKINKIPVVVAVMDFRFLGGSLGSGTGEKILLSANYALRHNLPYIMFCASGGARMQEGTLSLMQMAKTCAAIGQLHSKGLPYISVLTDPTTGGVSASYALIGDLNIAEPGAMIAFAGRRVIEQTIKQELPKDFQTAEYLQKHGFIDHIVPRSELKDFLHNVLSYWRA